MKMFFNHGIHRIHGTMVSLVLLFGVAVSAVAAEPGITVEARQRYPWNGLVDLKFTITGECGTKYDTSFTAKDMVGGTNIAMKTIRKSNGVATEEKEKLLSGTYNWVWDAAADLPKDFKCDRMTVTGTTEQSQGLYMVIDLSSGANSSKYPVSYLDDVPSGGWSDEYKTTKLVLRRIYKGTNSAGGSMSTDMWVGIFEVTQKQYLLVRGDNAYPSPYGYLNWHFAKDNRYPIEGVDSIAVDNFLSNLKIKSILKKARRPTPAEWQYTCRSGTATDLNSGEPLTVLNANRVAYWGLSVSGSTAYEKWGYGTGKPTIVGSYNANSWGLYDMHGNVSEVTTHVSVGVGSSAYLYSGGSYNSVLAEINVLSEKCPNGSYAAAGFRIFADIE